MGRRWGKTYMAGAYALACADFGASVAWVVPTYKNARAPWRFIERALGSVRKRVNINKTERLIDFPSGGLLGIYSGDNDTAIRGEAFDVVVVDEAAMIGEQTYTDVIQPTVADRDGVIVLISTPKRRNWFWREFVRGQADGKSIVSFTAPSAANPMPTIRQAAERAQYVVPERTYRQEWLAEFIDDTGGGFRNINEAATAIPQLERLPGHEYIFGVDWGKTNDYTVITVLDTHGNQVVHVDRFNQIDYVIQLGRLNGLAARFQPVTIIAERNSIGEPLIEAMQRQGLPVRPFQTSNATKTNAIDALALAFEQRTITILPDPVLIGELQSYEAEQLPSGLIRYGAPDGMHDDCVMSLALAWQGVAAAVPMFL